ncbi:hypothetical protein TUM12370_20560 [Salmonella enterica subsp. enterica serovar Choleraesuis]|nr:hypothetical protein TUM12370_20560 [Salmonella enterica subsp. enterica serovar Choleraesuis]
MQALYAVQAMALNDGWIGAGFVRDAVWDNLHGYGKRTVAGDVDVVWFDSQCPTEDRDKALEQKLRQQIPAFDWSVKNQARMHQRNGDKPYTSTQNALRYWPETVTAVAARAVGTGLIEIIAPYGLDDLFELRLRPTPRFEREKFEVFHQRITAKCWLKRYPMLRLSLPDNQKR